jgi:hypothetical protein
MLSGIDIGHQFVVESAMTILQRTGRYIFVVSVFILVLQVTAVTAQNKKGGVTVSYESSGSSRVARFKNSNSFRVRVEFSYNGTKVHGSAETSGQDAVFVPANYFRHVWWPWDFYHIGPNHWCLCGRTETANAITVVFGEKSRRFDADALRLRIS